MKHILIVEDNPRNMKLVRDVLAGQGLCHGGGRSPRRTGSRSPRPAPPDLVLMDIQLPGMNGIDALRVLRGERATSDIPVIAVTASVMQHDRG